MRPNAISVANYFVELAQRDKKELRLLGLVMRVYITHGFSLAFDHKSLLDQRFDVVEAWKYGPIIPSVYHSFKQYRNQPITDKAVVMKWNESNTPVFLTPVLKTQDARDIAEMVWKRYSKYTDNGLVELFHQRGTPWGIYYIPEQNCRISDAITAEYYEHIVNNAKRKIREKERGFWGTYNR